MSEYRLKPLPHQRPRNETLRTPLSDEQTEAILRVIPEDANSEVMLRELEETFMRYRTGKPSDHPHRLLLLPDIPMMRPPLAGR